MTFSSPPAAHSFAARLQLVQNSSRSLPGLLTRTLLPQAGTRFAAPSAPTWKQWPTPSSQKANAIFPPAGLVRTS